MTAATDTIGAVTVEKIETDQWAQI
jgi:hypothetical protein